MYLQITYGLYIYDPRHTALDKGHITKCYQIVKLCLKNTHDKITYSR